MSTKDVQLVRDFYIDEITDHTTYLALATAEPNLQLRKALTQAAAIEQKHSAFWRAYLESRGARVPEPRVRRVRALVLKLLQRLVSPVLLVAALELGESRALKAYFQCLKNLDLSEQEKATLRDIILEEIEHEITFRDESERLGLGTVRDFVLGMNDGLVEVLGVVTGLSAIYVSNPLVVAVSGLVVGVAGALSMGIGSFISVRSQRQVSTGMRERMEVLFEVAPSRAVDQYRKQLTDSGVPTAVAADVAAHIGTNREALSRLLLHQQDTSEIRSGLLTALAYLGGAGPPLLPYFFAGNSLTALSVSVPLAVVALTLVATAISLFSGISIRKKVLEMVVSAFAAAALSFAFGKVLQGFTGVSV